MNKKTILKIILSIITIALITCLTTSVFAASEDDEVPDLMDSLNNQGKPDDTDKETTIGDKETTTDKETTGDKETEGNKETTVDKPTTVDKNIPQTGLEDTMPIAILFVA